jgi:hypothetical protein
VNCRSVVVQQMSVVRTVGERVEIRSFYLPFECEACNSDYELLATAEEARAPEFLDKLNERYTCKRCSRKLTFMDDESTYFRFLRD